MNIRQRETKVYVPSHQVELNIHRPIYKTNFWGVKEVLDYEWKKEKTWVESKWINETHLEYLNPETKNWEPLPKVVEESQLDKKCLNNLEGGHIYAY